MPRVSGDTQAQAGSAWLAASPPTWLMPTRKAWVAELEPGSDEANEAVAAFLRATLSRSSSVMRRLTKSRAA